MSNYWTQIYGRHANIFQDQVDKHRISCLKIMVIYSLKLSKNMQCAIYLYVVIRYYWNRYTACDWVNFDFPEGN